MEYRDLLNFIQDILGPLGVWRYLLIFGTALLESIAFLGLIIPGVVLMLFFGFLTSEGIFSLPWLIGLTILGSLMGDCFSFWLGKRDYSIFSKKNRLVQYMIRKKYLQKGEEFFLAHGGKSVFLGRFIGPFRPIIPFIAGILKMQTKKFLFWTILSAVIWSVLYGLLGFFFGEAWNVISHWSPRVTIFAIAIFVILMLANTLKTYISRKGREYFLALREKRKKISAVAVNLPAVEKSMEKHPRFWDFLRDRWSKTELIGRPMTWGAILSCYLILIFTSLIKKILELPFVVNLDNSVSMSLLTVRFPFFVDLFSVLTMFGSWQAIVAEIILVSAILFYAKKREYILPLFISAGGSYITSAIGKILIERARPDAMPVFVENSFAFPSAHAAIAIGFYGFILYYLMRNISNWAIKTNIFFFGLLIILGIGFSRIYLGEHYLTDVIGGYILGGLWLLVSINFYRWLVVKLNK